MQLNPLPVPHKQRQAIIETDRFEQLLAVAGWTVQDTRPIYTDPDVFRQQWLRCPDGATYPERDFYRFFGSTPCRKLFRYLLTHGPCSRETIEQICPQDNFLSSLLTFICAQGWFVRDGRWFVRSDYQGKIRDIGRTLEWYVAEWLRLNYSIDSLVPVRHGVQLVEMPLPGDLDVVALLNDGRVICVECKSSTTHVDTEHCVRFLQRVEAFRPTLAILLIDTCAPFAESRLAACNTALHIQGLPLLKGRDGFYWSGKRICLINTLYGLSTALRMALQWSEML